MAESIVYLGRHITFSLTERTYGVWHWTYTIDNVDSFSNEGAPFPTRSLAMADAVRNAKDRLIRSTPVDPTSFR